MAWNEPGGSGNKKPDNNRSDHDNSDNKQSNNKDRDPWGNNNRNDGPPDFDELLKNFGDKLSALLSGKPARKAGSGNGRNGGGGNGGSTGPSGASAAAVLGVLAVLSVIAWGIMGFYTVDAKEQVVVLRLGKFQQINGEGLHWNPPLIDELFKEVVTTEREYPASGIMLTQDQNLVELPVKVQYRIGDIKKFVLEVEDPIKSLQHATDSSLRHVVGSSKLYEVLSEGRAKIAVDVKQRLQSYLRAYNTGIDIIAVNIQEGKPPAAVKDAFDDVIKAREDEERVINVAQAYSNEVLPVARGAAQRALEEASAYREQVVAKAEGEAQRFELLLNEYQQAPEVTRKRLYLDTIEEVMRETPKVLLDSEGGNNLTYLPLDQLMKDRPNQQTDAQLKTELRRRAQQALTTSPNNDANRRRSGESRTSTRGGSR